MIRNRRAVVLSAATALLTLASIAGAAAAHTTHTSVYLPAPPCGGYVECKPETKPWQKGDPIVFRPMGELSAKTAAISGAIGDGDIGKASARLDGLFSGSGSQGESGGGAVYAGDWTVKPHTDARLSKSQLASRGSETFPLIERIDGKQEVKILDVGWEHRDIIEETGQAIQDKIIEHAINKAIEKVDNANKAIDRIGDGLRSDGDSALQKGTQAQKDAERKHGKQ